jgi:hypothetical protein
MRSKAANLPMLMLAIGLLVTPAQADTQVRVVVRGPNGEPIAGIAVTIRQAAGYRTAEGDVSPPAVVGAATTDADGTTRFHLAGVPAYDVYSVAADDKAGGRHASTAVFAGETHWPEAILRLSDPLPAINLERVAAAKAATSCDHAAYNGHVQHVREAIARQQRSVATLDNAIAQYAQASSLAFPNLDAARAQLAAAQRQSDTADDVATLQHYVLLRVLADNMRAGLEADRVSEQSIATLQLCSNEHKAGVQMRPRCPPGWQTHLQTAQSDDRSNCHQRSSGTGREQN